MLEGSEPSDELPGHRAGSTRRRFPSPFRVPTPAGAEGWEELYPYALPFSEDRKAYEEGAFWFRDTIHWPRVLTPFEATFLQLAFTALGQFNHRHFLIPTARGVDVRLLHGYCYLSPGVLDDPELVASREAAFAERAGWAYATWPERYDRWMAEVRDLLQRMEAVTFPALPDAVPVEEVTSGRGLGRPFDLTEGFHRLVDLGNELWQRHFELLNLGYAAYLDYFHFCRARAPEATELAIAKTVMGIDVELFRPDRELRRLAAQAVAWGLGEALCDGPVEGMAERLAGLAHGREWLDDLERTRHPWFNYSTGPGFYHDDPVWNDRLDVPFAFLCDHVRHLLQGISIDVPVQEVAAERDRLARWLRAAIPPGDRSAFDEHLRLARTVFPFVENHNFYVEHWGMSVLWRKARELSAVLVAGGFWPAVDDVFLLRPDEVDGALWDLVSSWATGTPARGPHRWPAEVVRRRAILAACAGTPPPRALGVPPAAVTEPFTVMLWGITSEAVDAWLAEGDGRCDPTGGDAPAGHGSDAPLRGFPASPGVVEGRARVVHRADELDAVEDGEILVAELTAPSWAPVFERIAGTVTECGGMMSHVAIVCREYGLPAVTGVSFAASTLRTGQWLRVDGDTGHVWIVG